MLLNNFDITDFPKFETDKIKNSVCKDMYINILQANVKDIRHKLATKLTIYGTLRQITPMNPT